MPGAMVSVIITCKDQGHQVIRTIHSVIEQDFEEAFKILLIDDGSRDGTVHTVRGLFGKRIEIVEKDGSEGWLNSLQLACQKAAGEILAFTDPHCTVPSDWLRTIVHCFRSNPRLRIMTGPAFHGFRFMEKLSALTLHGQFLSMKRGLARHIFDANFAIARDTLADLLLHLPVSENINDGVGCSLLSSQAKRSEIPILYEPKTIGRHISPCFKEYLKEWGGISAQNTIEIRLRNPNERGGAILRYMFLAPFIYPAVRMALDVQNAWRFRKTLRLRCLEFPLVMAADVAGKFWYLMGLVRSVKMERAHVSVFRGVRPPNREPLDPEM